MKKYKSLISMCALAGLANCAKADIVSAQEHLGLNWDIKSIVVNNPTASIGSKATPWIFVRPDGKSGFANDFTTNAISVVSEDGETYYAHVKGQDNDRTKVIKFTINKDGIPSTHGDVIDTTSLGEEGSVTNMANRKLVGVTHGCLCFYPTKDYGTSLFYNPETGETFSDEAMGSGITQKCLASCQDESNVHVLCNLEIPDSDKVTKIKTIGMGVKTVANKLNFATPLSDENRVMAADSGNVYYIGDLEGNVMAVGDNGWVLNGIMPGAISSITPSGRDVFVTSTKTNVFANVGFEDFNGRLYNIVSPDGRRHGWGKLMEPKTNDGIVRIIDNRHKGGKLMCVTTKGIHSIDD